MAIGIIAKIALGAKSAAGGAGRVSGGTSAGTIAKGVVISQALLNVAKKTWETMKDISGHMAATFNIMKKSAQLFLRPIADTIGLILRPFALAMLRVAIPFYQKFAAPGGLFEALMTPPEERTEDQKKKALGGGILGGMATGGAVGAAIGGTIGGPVGAVIGGMIGAAVGGLIPTLKAAEQGVENLKTLFSGLWTNFVDDVKWAFADVKDFFRVKIPEWWNNASDKIISKWEGLKNFIGETIPDWIEDKWDSIKTFFGETVPDWITGAWDSVKDFFTVTIPGWFTDMFSSIKEKWSSIKSRFGFGEDSKAIGGAIGQTGLYKLHAGEFVVRSGQAQEMKNQAGNTTNFSPTINVNARVDSAIDIRTLAEDLSKFMEIEYRRKVSY